MKNLVFALAMSIVALPLCARAGAAIATPSPSPSPFTTIEIGVSSEQLSKGKGTWTGTSAGITHQFAPRTDVYGTARIDSRFGNTDDTYTGGLYLPSSPNTILNVEASFSPTHNVLPQRDLEVSLDHRLASGWGYTLGTRNRGYTAVEVQGGWLLVDRYWRNFRAAYSLNGSHLSNVPGVAFGHTLLFTDYYGIEGTNSVTLSFNAGREVENTGTAVLASSVTGATLGGVHWLSPAFGFSWSASTLRQGTLYSRSGVQIGLRSRF